MPNLNPLPDARLSNAITHSRYAQRLLTSEPERIHALAETFQQPFDRNEMQDFLDSQIGRASCRERVYARV